MNSSTSRADTGHREIWLQIPWYVNDRIDAAQRERVETHLRDCAACRSEVAQQRRVHAVMSADPGVEVLPSASLARLRQRIDQLDPPVGNAASRSGESRQRMLMAAAVAGVAVVLGLVLVVQHPAGAPSTGYFTVSTPRARPAQEVIRVVFAPPTTVAQMQRVLEQNEVRIVAGPTEAGVYSLALTGTQPVSTTLRRLRSLPEVRFAEATAPLAPDETR